MRALPTKRLARLLPWAGSGAVLWYLVHHVPLGAVWAAAKQARLDLVLAAGVGTLVMHWVASWRLGLLMRAQHCRFTVRQLFEINLVIACYRLVMPGGTVGAGAVRIVKYLQVERNVAGMLSSLVLDRLLATCGLTLLGLVCWLWDAPPMPGQTGWLLLGGFFGIAALSAAMLRGTGLPAIHALLAAGRLPWLAQPVRAWTDALEKFRGVSAGEAVRLLLLTLLAHATGIVTFAWLGGAVGIHLPVSTWGWMRGVVVLATMLPISVAGLGVRDGVLLYALREHGVGDDQALALSVLVFGVTVLGVAVLGGLLEVWAAVRTSGRLRPPP